MGPMVERDPSEELKAENDRLIALLEANGIQWRMLQAERSSPASTAESTRLSTDEKVTLFRRLFRGRTDVYPIRWESKTTAKSGYSPACANEWRASVCEKPRIKCGDCSNRMLIPLSDSVIFDHLAGEHTVGVYPLLEDNTCYFLVIDFDEAEWREDAAPLCSRVVNLACPLLSRFRAPAKGRTRGCSSLAGSRPAMLVAWVRPSSAIPAREPGN